MIFSCFLPLCLFFCTFFSSTIPPLLPSSFIFVELVLNPRLYIFQACTLPSDFHLQVLLFFLLFHIFFLLLCLGVNGASSLIPNHLIRDSDCPLLFFKWVTSAAKKLCLYWARKPKFIGRVTHYNRRRKRRRKKKRRI